MIGIAIFMLGIGSESYAQMKNWQWDDDLLTLSTPRNVVRLDNSYKLSKLSEEQNIALGNIAKDDFPDPCEPAIIIFFLFLIE